MADLTFRLPGPRALFFHVCALIISQTSPKVTPREDHQWETLRNMLGCVLFWWVPPQGSVSSVTVRTKCFHHKGKGSWWNMHLVIKIIITFQVSNNIFWLDHLNRVALQFPIIFRYGTPTMGSIWSSVRFRPEDKEHHQALISLTEQRHGEGGGVFCRDWFSSESSQNPCMAYSQGSGQSSFRQGPGEPTSAAHLIPRRLALSRLSRSLEWQYLERQPALTLLI